MSDETRKAVERVQKLADLESHFIRHLVIRMNEDMRREELVLPTADLRTVLDALDSVTRERDALRAQVYALGEQRDGLNEECTLLRRQLRGVRSADLRVAELAAKMLEEQDRRDSETALSPEAGEAAGHLGNTPGAIKVRLIAHRDLAKGERVNQSIEDTERSTDGEGLYTVITQETCVEGEVFVGFALSQDSTQEP